MRCALTLLPLATEDLSILHALKALKEELQAVNNRVSGLEAENFALQKQLEIMLQAEERRKFLGTDSVKIPFGINIEASSGASYRIQVHSELKVSELIRRVRAKAGLSPTNTPNPRVAVDGKQAGHGMTLGEIGVTKEKVPEVVFRYDTV